MGNLDAGLRAGTVGQQSSSSLQQAEGQAAAAAVVDSEARRLLLAAQARTHLPKHDEHAARDVQQRSQ